jgi:hypothetical protein
MAAPAINRLVLTDDDGTGLTGTPLNNALFQDLQNRIDQLSAAIVAQFPTPANIVTTAGFALASRNNKAARVATLGNVPAVSPDMSLYDEISVWNLAQALMINPPTWSGAGGITGYDNAPLIIRIHDAGATMPLTWVQPGGYYSMSGIPLPTFTIPNVFMFFGFKFSYLHNAWQCVAQSLGTF